MNSPSSRTTPGQFIRWIWLGAIIMALGGVLAASDRRYRLTARRRAAAAVAELASGQARV